MSAQIWFRLRFAHCKGSTAAAAIFVDAGSANAASFMGQLVKHPEGKDVYYRGAEQVDAPPRHNHYRLDEHGIAVLQSA